MFIWYENCLYIWPSALYSKKEAKAIWDVRKEGSAIKKVELFNLCVKVQHGNIFLCLLTFISV